MPFCDVKLYTTSATHMLTFMRFSPLRLLSLKGETFSESHRAVEVVFTRVKCEYDNIYRSSVSLFSLHISILLQVITLESAEVTYTWP